jgi:hypothetical protein
MSKYLPAHIDMLLGSDGTIAQAYIQQLQGQLWISEREWVDICGFYPGLPSCIARVPRDEKFIVALSKEMDKFLAMFDERLEKLKALGYISNLTEAKSKQKPKSEAEEITGLGVSEADVTQYIEALRAKSAL